MKKIKPLLFLVSCITPFLCFCQNVIIKTKGPNLHCTIVDMNSERIVYFTQYDSVKHYDSVATAKVFAITDEEPGKTNEKFRNNLFNRNGVGTMLPGDQRFINSHLRLQEHITRFSGKNCVIAGTVLCGAGFITALIGGISFKNYTEKDYGFVEAGIPLCVTGGSVFVVGIPPLAIGVTKLKQAKVYRNKIKDNGGELSFSPKLLPGLMAGGQSVAALGLKFTF